MKHVLKHTTAPMTLENMMLKGEKSSHKGHTRSDSIYRKPPERMNPQGRKSAQRLPGPGGRPGELLGRENTLDLARVVCARHCKYAKRHATAALVKLMLCELHLNKSLFFKSNKNC